MLYDLIDHMTINLRIQCGITHVSTKIISSKTHRKKKGNMTINGKIVKTFMTKVQS